MFFLLLKEVTITYQIEKEVNLYLGFPKSKFEQDPIQWWSINKDTYPYLYVFAKKYMMVQATSVASERVFSRGGCVLTDLRSSTNDKSIYIFKYE